MLTAGRSPTCPLLSCPHDPARLGCLAIDAVRALDEAHGDEVLATEYLRRRMVMR